MPTGENLFTGTCLFVIYFVFVLFCFRVFVFCVLFLILCFLFLFFSLFNATDVNVNFLINKVNF